MPSQGLVQRWSLKTFRREKTVPLRENLHVNKIVMGSDATHCVLLWAKTTGVFYDLKTMKPMTIKGPMLAGHKKWGLNLTVSADGLSYLGWVNADSRGGQHTLMRLSGKTTTIAKGEAGIRGSPQFQPNYDGSMIVSNQGAVYAGDLKRIPAAVPRCFSIGKPARNSRTNSSSTPVNSSRKKSTAFASRPMVET